MLRLFLLFITLGITSGVIGAEPQRKTPNSELGAAVSFLSGLPPEVQLHTRFFSTYAVPEELREKAVLTLSFVCHSLIGPGQSEDTAVGAYYPLAVAKGDKFEPRTLVPGSQTLYYIDLRWFNWSAKAWDEAARQDAYFDVLWLKPENAALANSVLRADWFIAHATDPTYQQDRDEKRILFREFLYANTVPPKTIEEFRKTWGVDAADLQKRQLQFGSLVTTNTTVSLRNRILAFARTPYGNYCETSDVKNDVGVRDYKNNIPLNKPIPSKRDASETITNNAVGLQVYDLYDGAGNSVEFADATVVRDRSKNDVRVKTMRSCITCHSAGLIPTENVSEEDLRQGVFINIKDYNDKLKFERVYLSGGAADIIDDGQRIFEKAMMRVNGLDPVQNTKNYEEIMEWYEEPVGLKQAALECGLSEQEYRIICDQEVSGNLASLVKYNRPIVRSKWDIANQDGVPGEYVRSMLLIHSISYDQFLKELGLQKVVDIPVEPVKANHVYAVTAFQAYLDDGKTLVTVPEKTQILLLTTEDQNGVSWSRVQFNGNSFWVKSDRVKHE